MKTGYVLCAAVFLGFGIQLIGISLTDNNLNPLISPAPQALKLVGYAGIAISFFAPLLSLGSLVSLFRASKRSNTPLPRKFVGTIVLAFVVSVLEWFWTMSGHPTWFQGYAG
jgi:hypothetical protein